MLKIDVDVGMQSCRAEEDLEAGTAVLSNFIITAVVLSE
jgi:hypothetical protein